MVKNVRFHDRVPRLNSGLRIGYVQYHNRFKDRWFFYGGYSFWPFSPVVCSPWYYYPQLPPYLLLSVVFISNPPAYVQPTVYNWAEPSPEVTYGELDYAIEDIVNAFEDHDLRAIDRLIPEDGDVAIFLDGTYSYSVRASDFRDILHDSVSDVRTTGYHVLSVNRYSGGSALVEGQHNTIDPWGDRQTIYQRIRLVREGGYWVIREFGTSESR